MSSKILDWNKYLQKSAEAVSEGIVMLKNDNNALPLDKNKETAVFGRIQLHYYKSGTGSGGLVNVSRVVGITDGLIEAGAKINQRLLDVYNKWDEENPFEYGDGWAGEPWSQKEMPLEDSLAAEIAEKCETAVVVIGRTAGEEKDSKLEKGSYLLTDEEENMLGTVKKHFKKTVVLLNTGGLIDMSFVKKYEPDSVLYVWQGGMVGGTGTADVLLGKVSPSGKLPDTIAYSPADYPSDKNFGDTVCNFYCEDIYVGYRYFETFASEKVIYPFGFGLSYTSFDIKNLSFSRGADNAVFLEFMITNTGHFSGKEVVQIYMSSPQGVLGKPARILCGFEKTPLLSPGESCKLKFTVTAESYASYDDSGATGNKSCYVLESGEYTVYGGNSVRAAEKIFSFELTEDVIVARLSQALAPTLPFNRLKPLFDHNGGVTEKTEEVPLAEVSCVSLRERALPAEIPFSNDKEITLADVKNKKHSMEEFIARFTDYDLSCIIRGEGMCSPKVTAGTAAAFGGVSKELAKLGIPCGCCSDGPSGMRLDCGTKAFSLPNGTLIASTFNRQLITELFGFTGMEMQANHVDCLLGPGMNIHRHPLNGRNFEYFSEDPYLTGHMASAELKGLHSQGVTGTIKHFCGNNQETGRHSMDCIISERALREIYLKGFEIAVKEGKADTIMTTYGSVNGLWTAGSYDLTTQILRNEWGFRGMVMTDWWADINRRGCPPDRTDFAAMAAAQNDVYMVCADGADNNDNTLAELSSGGLTRGELQRNAANICSFLMNTHAMERLTGCYEEVAVINRDDDSDAAADTPVEFFKINGGKMAMPLNISTVKGNSYTFGLDISDTGFYRVTLTADSDQSELAQLPVTVFSSGSPAGTLTWNGTGGKPVSLSCKGNFFSKYTVIRLYFGQSGLNISEIKFDMIDEKEFFG
ncbi:MAG: glycoside hydrolase family 3 C-terminal domain-containing protein [Ruminococcus sp.]|nr:glycoside hydrolase family 3 C-terminal domain-containing protein [Ruminococcus sp.]